MKSIINFSFALLSVLILSSCFGCWDDKTLPKDLTYIKLDVILFDTIQVGLMPDFVSSVAQDFILEEKNGLVPLISLQNANDSKNKVVVTKELEKRDAGATGNIEKVNFVKRHFKNEILPKVSISDDFVNALSINPKILVEYDNKLKNAVKEKKFYIKYSDDVEDATTKIHTPKALKTEIEKLALEGHFEITILYNMPFVSDGVLQNMEMKDLVGRTEYSNGMADKMAKKKELDKIDSDIAVALSQDNMNFHLWYLRAINRTYVGDKDNAMIYLENAARVSIEKDSNEVMKRDMEIDQKTRLQQIAIKKLKWNAILFALQERDKDLITAYFGEAQKIPKSSNEYKLLMRFDNIPYINENGYTLTVVSRDANNRLHIRATVPMPHGKNNEIKETKDVYCEPGKTEQVPFGNNILYITNDGTLDKNYAQLRISRQVVKQEPTTEIFEPGD